MQSRRPGAQRRDELQRPQHERQRRNHHMSEGAYRKSRNDFADTGADEQPEAAENR